MQYISTCASLAWFNQHHDVFMNSYRLKFPSILLVYFLSALLVSDMVIIINLAEQGSLLCQNSVDLTEIIEHPTPFCSFLGKQL